MAKKDDTPQEEQSDTANTAKNGGKKKLIVMVVVGIVLVGLSVGATLFAVKMLHAPEQVAEMAEADLAPAPKPAIYYPLKPPIIVNFNVKGRQRFLQAELTILTREEDVVSAIELHQPMIRNALVLLIGGQLLSEIQTAEGKELLRQQCLQEVQRLLEQEIGKPGVEQILFTSFVLQ